MLVLDLFEFYVPIIFCSGTEMHFLALYQNTRSAQQQLVGIWLLLLVSVGYLTLKWLVSPAQFPATKHLTFRHMLLKPLGKQKFAYGRMGGAASSFWISSCWHLSGPLNGIPCHIILLLAFLRAHYWSSIALIKPHPKHPVAVWWPRAALYCLLVRSMHASILSVAIKQFLLVLTMTSGTSNKWRKG